MLPDGIMPFIKNGQVFDFSWKTGISYIVDYHRLNNKIILSDDLMNLRFNEVKYRTKITSIDELRDSFESLISAAVQILKKSSKNLMSDILEIKGYRGLFSSVDIHDFRYLKRNLLAEQLVFDVLFDKYLSETKEMTRSNYSKDMSKLLCNNVYSYCDTINKELERGMEVYYNMMKYSELRSELELLGVIPDKYAEYYNPRMKDNLKKKKPEYVWDYLYYNHSHKILKRQYRRQLTRNSRNYSYEEIINDLKEYNGFVKKLLPSENESVNKYFNMSMRYYALESYKRIDFMFYLADFMLKTGMDEINREHFLIKRFTPCVLVPVVENNEIQFYTKYKYYRAPLMIEKELQKEIRKDSFVDFRYYADQLSMYQYVRAKAYELFRYHGEFISLDYSEIKKFIFQYYNMRTYHESNEVWKVIEGKRWKDLNDEIRRNLKKIFNNFISINDLLFWKSSKREYTVPK